VLIAMTLTSPGFANFLHYLRLKNRVTGAGKRRLIINRQRWSPLTGV
jgi:hypothetical protein